jgi:hypothetical protein
LQYDPKTLQFDPDDIRGGSGEGFDTKPLVVNIDNTSGKLTLASFQVGASPSGLLDVARLRVRRSMESNLGFRITVDEVTDAAGNSLVRSNIDVGLVRTR